MFDVHNAYNGMYRVNIADVQKWAIDTIHKVSNDPYGQGFYPLDFGLGICIGWEDGFDADDTNDIINPENPTYHLCVKVCEDRADDFDFMYMPYNPKTGDVWDTDISLSNNDEVNKDTIEWLVYEYYSIITNSTYWVTISFNGFEKTYDTEYLNADDAEEDALESAQSDLDIVGYVHEDNDGNYYADVMFDNDENSKKVYYDTHHTYEYPDDAKAEILWEATQDLEVVSVESHWVW